MRRFFLPLLLASAGGAQAAAPALPLAELAEQPFWLALGHYEAARLGGWRSHVDDAQFFLAEQGAHDPQAELRATLAALYAPLNDADQHAQCRYPARTRWLREQLQPYSNPA